MTGILAKYFGLSYSRTAYLVLQNRQALSIAEKKLSHRNYTNSQFVSKQQKQITQKKKKRYLKRIKSLDPDHDKDMEGKLLLIFFRSKLYATIYPKRNYQAYLMS